ncbi:1-acyl-sn-glycerol-3-phosphate acyltransferase [Fodinibius saliphilus]|uniref:1-acyl-sn-glycerol-3-phosphate acyltransferase n=1 Tax=Fodinibius saliphilus TaxID=1920650 RepID=UPI0011087B45|nr:1-acyl-sn-glycerol-3-phosphate acyltransferase [Fodinibius saliphilus]
MNVDIRGWTLTHWWVRPVVKVWFEIYHKSVTYSGTEHINWDKPIIFAPSHQNAFSDALCLILPTQYTNNRFIYPLIRADAFGTNRVIDWILTAFHMLPVYRPRDQVNLKEQNESVFEDCYDILAKNRNLLIHPEGNCIPKKQLRRFKKGLARIALGAEERHGFELDVTIIPVGINYSKITEARKGIHVQFGEPIAVDEYEKQYRQHQASAITELIRRVEQGVREVTVDIEPDKYELVEHIVQLKKQTTDILANVTAYGREEVEIEKETAKEITNTLTNSPQLVNVVEENIEQLYSELNKEKLDINSSLTERYSIARLFSEGIGFIIAFPIFLYGTLNNIVPWQLAHKLTAAIEEKQFISSARMLLGLILFPVFYIGQGALCWEITESVWWAIVYLLSLPFSGVLSLNLYEKWKCWQQQLRLKSCPKDVKEKITDLIAKICNPTDETVIDES